MIWAPRTISKVLVALLAKGSRPQACSSTINEDDREAKSGCSGRLRARDGGEALGNMGLERHVFTNGTERAKLEYVDRTEQRLKSFKLKSLLPGCSTRDTQALTE